MKSLVAMVLTVVAASAAFAEDNKVAATVTGENYCLHCTLVMADKPDAECGPESCSYALKVTEAKDAEGNAIEGMKGKTLHYITSDNAKKLKTDTAMFGKTVELKGNVFVAECAIDVEESTIVTAAAGGDDFSDFDDFDFSGGGNKASARR
jgi:hypothetical protein